MHLVHTHEAQALMPEARHDESLDRFCDMRLLAIKISCQDHHWWLSLRLLLRCGRSDQASQHVPDGPDLESCLGVVGSRNARVDVDRLVFLAAIIDVSVRENELRAIFGCEVNLTS